MTNAQKEIITRQIRDFRLPRYHEIPDVGLYLEQTTQYICSYLEPVLSEGITSSMISNYVKKGLISSPSRRRYSREQIAYLFFIAVAKHVLSLDALQNFILLQKRTYSVQRAYDYFVQELEDILLFCFDLKTTLDTPEGEESTDEKRLLYSCVASVAQKIYLEKSLQAIAEA